MKNRSQKLRLAEGWEKKKKRGNSYDKKRKKEFFIGKKTGIEKIVKENKKVISRKKIIKLETPKDRNKERQKGIE